MPQRVRSPKVLRGAPEDHFGNMWRSLPRSVRRNPTVPRVEREAQGDRARRPRRQGAVCRAEESKYGIDAALVIAYVIALLLAVCAAVGLVQILPWMTPGGSLSAPRRRTRMVIEAGP